MNILLLLAVLSSTHDAPPGITPDHCDVIEINHVYRVSVVNDPPAALHTKVDYVATYLLLWDWSPRKEDWVIVSWVRWNGRYPQHRSGRLWFAHFHDRGHVLRVVSAPCFRETWTDHDPEVLNQKVFPREERRGLTPAVKPVE